MLFKLCLALGFPHPDYLAPLLSSKQIADWYAYFDINAFGQDHTDYLIAQLSALIYNANRGKGRRARKPVDFLPFHKKRPPSPEEIKSAFMRALPSGYRRKS